MGSSLVPGLAEEGPHKVLKWPRQLSSPGMVDYTGPVEGGEDGTFLQADPLCVCVLGLYQSAVKTLQIFKNNKLCGDGQR